MLSAEGQTILDVISHFHQRWRVVSGSGLLVGCGMGWREGVPYRACA